jgi:hypothetical protein
MRTKNYKSGGFYWERELYQSEAFLTLSKNAIKALIALLDNRQREPVSNAKDKKGRKRKPNFINLNRLEIPYGTLEKVYLISRSNIPPAIDQLLTRGFITIAHHGGTCKHDKSKYAWSNNWMLWKPGIIFAERPKDTVKRGYQGKRLGATEEKKQNSRLKQNPYTRRK